MKGIRLDGHDAQLMSTPSNAVLAAYLGVHRRTLSKHAMRHRYGRTFHAGCGLFAQELRYTDEEAKHLIAIVRANQASRLNVPQSNHKRNGHGLMPED